MQVRYFVHHEGNHLGPLTFTEIEAQLNSKELFPTDYVYVGERGDWIGMLEFILVHGPKQKVMQPALQTAGARYPEDDSLDWQRFASGLPAFGSGLMDRNLIEAIYPIAPGEGRMAVVETPPTIESDVSNFPPPPPPPRLIMERRHPEKSRPERPPAPMAKPQRLTPQVQPLLRPVARPAPAMAAKRIDVSATARVEVLPPAATLLSIQITGEARVSEELEVVVVAQSENGELDTTFNDVVHLTCDRPLAGLEPLRFMNGTARLRVRCLTEGAHQFSLAMEPQPTGFARPDTHELEGQGRLIH